MSAVIVRGNALAIPLPDASVDLVVTSPPYWNVRDYTDDGVSLADQLGREPTPTAYVAALLAVLEELGRVLRPDGVAFVNLGDRYSDRANAGSTIGHSGRHVHQHAKIGKLNSTGTAPAKSLLNLPHRFVIAATGAGWVHRNTICWWKRNAMSHPVTDRLVNKYEWLFLLTKQQSYRFNLDAIREPLRYPERTGHLFGGRKLGATRIESSDRVAGGSAYVPKYVKADDKGYRPADGQQRRGGHRRGRNPGDVWADLPDDVWDVPTEPSPLEHFAGFPSALVRRCVLAGSSPGGVVVDPFAGTGTVPAVASALGRIGIGVDLSGDYCRLAKWRCGDPNLRAKVLGVARPEPVAVGQDSLW